MSSHNNSQEHLTRGTLGHTAAINPNGSTEQIVIGATVTRNFHNPKGQIDALHGLRFLAAFCILFLHSSEWIAHPVGFPYFGYIGNLLGIFGMTLFFVLSGFVIQYNYENLFAGTKFVWAVIDFGAARFARLFPLYAFVAVIGILFDNMPLWLNSQPRDLAIFGLHEITLTHTWFYITVNNGHLVGQNGFGMSWSISTEMFFYLVFPLLALSLMFLRSGRKATIVTIIFALLAQLLFIEAYLWREYIVAWGKNFIPFASDLPGQEFERWLLYLSPWARIFEFSLGCLTALTFMRLADRPVSAGEQRLGWGLTLFALALLAIIGSLNWANANHSALASMFQFLVNRSFGTTLPTALLIFCVARYRTPVSFFLAAPWMVALGEISYSIYAIQYPIVRPFFISDQSSPPTDLPNMIIVVGKLVMAIALTLAASYGTYRTIEVPARTWIRRHVDGALISRLGPKAANAKLLSTSPFATIGFSIGSLVLILTLCTCYQFFIVARFMAPTH